MTKRNYIYLLVTLIFCTSCSDPKPPIVHKKPFYVNDKGGSVGKDYCVYEFIDSSGNVFSILDNCSKFNVGDSIK